MKILIVNDDGLTFAVESLKKFLESEGHLVNVVVPDSDRSGSSGSITVNKVINVNKVEDNIELISGTPVDCVHYGIYTYDVDLVVSGINLGVNLADDLMYSGTFNAAREAFLIGKPALAVSYGSKLEEDFEKDLPTIKESIQKLLLILGQRNDVNLANVNIPKDAKNEVSFTFSDKREHYASVNKIDDSSFMIGEIGNFIGLRDSDSQLFNEGYCTCTFHL